MGNARPLVRNHLERVSADMLEDHLPIIREYIRHEHGIYALYDDDDLYYVGLASSLQRRLTTHLRDRHQGKWNRFSIYVVRRADHIRELESLVLRIATPDGNSQKGKLKGSTNLRSDLLRQVQMHDRERRYHLLGGRRRKGARATRNSTAGQLTNGRSDDRVPPLKALGTTRMSIRGTINGKTITARVLSSGWIRLGDYDYLTPSAAATAAAGRRKNGWRFWRFRNSAWDWVPISELRGD